MYGFVRITSQSNARNCFIDSGSLLSILDIRFRVDRKSDLKAHKPAILCPNRRILLVSCGPRKLKDLKTGMNLYPLIRLVIWHRRDGVRADQIRGQDLCGPGNL